MHTVVPEVLGGIRVPEQPKCGLNDQTNLRGESGIGEPAWPVRGWCRTLARQEEPWIPP